MRPSACQWVRLRRPRNDGRPASSGRRAHQHHQCDRARPGQEVESRMRQRPGRLPARRLRAGGNATEPALCGAPGDREEPRPMSPYYDHGGITIYLGDCREILPGLGRFDLLLTDPPYGIGEAAGRNKSRSLLAVSKDYGDEDWDNDPPSRETLDACRAPCTHQIIFGGNYFDLAPSPCWLVWDKDNG